MAAFGGYPQNVTFSTVNVAKGGGSENLLINPRGKINQLNEPDGVLSAGVYFCDGWKAGASGAEVYRDADGFRLISGSIVQLVPNNLGAGRNLRSNMDIISGSPVMSINGGSDNVVSSDSEYISLEISGDNSKFTRTILAESLEIPIYQQVSCELEPCKKFIQLYGGDENPYPFVLNMHTSTSQYGSAILVPEMHKAPAVTVLSSTQGFGTMWASKKVLTVSAANDSGMGLVKFILDARP
ncbi:hypothetical protein [Vibrio cholerae]|uniref:hypothetical protein n=1 Tax=Vibrio cholerae TaxID=666 RepID=UPI001FA7528C|nr:hypothetical protein [Vibrio cholerae]MCI4613009.1 hypothetical protein [Vibrio cholerae]